MSDEPKIYDYVMQQLRAKRVPQKQVAAESGVPFSTVAKIAQRQIEDPSVHTIQKLADYFRTLDRVAEPERAAACDRDQHRRVAGRVGGRQRHVHCPVQKAPVAQAAFDFDDEEDKL